jgi:CHAT domain-containing protein
VFDGAAATKANFAAANRRGLLERTRYLHVAAHGYLSAVAPQWSSLVLGGEGGAPAYVTAAELATYDIGARLVVLSACETALGRDVAGEGIFGLPYALTVAGARGTLLTLWPVADRSTSVFMTRFYRKLARGVPPATALARTKREFLRDPEWSAPLYWAPFVLYGR